MHRGCIWLHRGCRCTILQHMTYMAAGWLATRTTGILRPRSGGGNAPTPGGLQATKPDCCRTPNIKVTVYPACKLQYTCRQISQMVILRDLKDFRISNVHVAKDIPLSLVALKGPADIMVLHGFSSRNLKNKLKLSKSIACVTKFCSARTCHLCAAVL